MSPPAVTGIKPRMLQGRPPARSTVQGSREGTEESMRQRGQSGQKQGTPGSVHRSRGPSYSRGPGSARVKRPEAWARGGLQRQQHSSQTSGVSQTVHPTYNNNFLSLKKKNSKWKMLLCEGMDSTSDLTKMYHSKI